MKTYKYVALITFAIFTGLIIIPSVKAEEIGMVTGSPTGTYIRFGKEIAKIAEKEGLNIKVKSSKGSLDNILRMDSTENAAFAIVQSDVLRFLKINKDRTMQRTAKRLRLMFPFYNEEVHLFARKDIKKFQDLNGKRVVVGADGSGNFITATNLLNIMGVLPRARYTHLGPSDAVEAVLLDEVDAMFYVAGKPVKLFKNLEKVHADSDFTTLVESVHFVPLEAPEMLKEYVHSEIGPEDYGWVKTTVSTVAVKAVLVSFDFTGKPHDDYYRRRCHQLGLLGKAIRDNIGELRKTGHPKWKEVNLEEHIGSWELDACSHQLTPWGKPGSPHDKVKIYQEKLKCTILGKCWKDGECVTCP